MKYTINHANITDRLEFHSETSKKFYKLEKTSGGYLAYWGRIGGAGQSTFYTDAQAQQKFREKIAKGYERVNAGLHEAAEDRNWARRKSEETHSGIDFERELRKL